MSYQVSYSRNDPGFEALPVAKITRYPLEKAAYKPYAQCCMCIAGTGEGRLLLLRMWAFEVYASPESELRGVFGLFRSPALSLHLRARADDPVRVDAWIEGGGDPVPVPVQSRPYNGEDLQGVYWGAEIRLSLGGLSGTSELLPLSAGTSFPGNFYKLRHGEWAHMGSFYPALFPEHPHASQSMYTPQSMDLFEIVS